MLYYRYILIKEPPLKIYITDVAIDLSKQIDIALYLGFDLVLSESRENLTIVYGLSQKAEETVTNLKYFKLLSENPFFKGPTWARLGSSMATLEYLKENDCVADVHNQNDFLSQKTSQ